ncbi:hypothetical protein ACWD4T_03510 [Streptomyces umbrinus]
MNVDDVIAEKIAAARARAEAAKRRRATLNAARQRGLGFRHAAKLRNLATPRDGAADPDDDIVIEVTAEEWHAGARAALARLGLTYAELEGQARRRDFTSAQAQVLWVSIGGTVNTDLLEFQDNPTEENTDGS